jgi:hypothetical protein
LANLWANISNSSSLQNSQEFKLNQKIFEKTEQFLGSLSLSSNYRIAFDPVLWVPKKTSSNVEITQIFGPFLYWDRGYDFLVLAEYHFEELEGNYKNQDVRKLEALGFQQHTSTENKQCDYYCYRVFMEFSGVKILQLDRSTLK